MSRADTFVTKKREYKRGVKVNLVNFVTFFGPPCSNAVTLFSATRRKMRV